MSDNFDQRKFLSIYKLYSSQLIFKAKNKKLAILRKLDKLYFKAFLKNLLASKLLHRLNNHALVQRIDIVIFFYVPDQVTNRLAKVTVKPGDEFFLKVLSRQLLFILFIFLILIFHFLFILILLSIYCLFEFFFLNLLFMVKVL